MTAVTLDDWLARLASATGDRVTIDAALVAELAGALGAPEAELRATLDGLLDFHAGAAQVDPAVARAAVFGAISATVLRHLGASAVRPGVARLVFSLERAEVTAGGLVLHARVPGAAPQDRDTADVVARLERAGLARGGEVVLRPGGGPREIRVVCRPPVSGPEVFLSYAHDDPGHKETVRTLAELLVRNGIDADMDQWAGPGRQDWQAWATGLITKADFVLIIASPAYRRAGDGLAKTGDNRGVQAESATIRDLLHQDRRTWTARLLPVVLPGHEIDEIPLFLQPYCADRYHVTELSDAGIEELLRALTGQPRYVRPELGAVPHLPPRSLPRPPARS
ncbi:toll/interleukin-1 receptor domain-containing protein [Amycolatopsis sp. NPDC051102]|uniref:toll/interleukin-1 receptor domain-containing protein n=1 Tax=Amycolatopsis sp. NPDC051102 TaxID=3155163 RepID=UPI0034332065